MKALIGNACTKLWQYIFYKRKGKPQTPDPQQKILAESVFPDHKNIKLYESLFWSSFKGLPVTCKKLLLLHWKEYNNTDIGNILHIDEESVNQHKATCTKQFLEKVMNHRDYSLFTKST